MRLNKQQRLRNAAEGFLAGLVAAGFEGPFTWAHHQWEGPFYRVWNQWPPASRRPQIFPRFQVGGSADGRTSQARDMLWQIKRTSPFAGHKEGPLNPAPNGLTPAEYLEISVEGATPDEWVELARDFLREMPENSA
ncbi:hypothetical protein GCM10022262_38090 [Georgenia daeguensis]|uniref:DUF4304 domain-containing protein n=1 Tax=Georgenia daeguensis TaxID=908355 RepID=A0ABP6UP49_9MICO